MAERSSFKSSQLDSLTVGCPLSINTHTNYFREEHIRIWRVRGDDVAQMYCNFKYPFRPHQIANIRQWSFGGE